VSNHIFVPTAGGAVVTVDMLMIASGGDPNIIEYGGYHEDNYARTPHGWKFKSRIHHALLNQGKRALPAKSTH
jgi:hypothetical protein